MIFDKPISVHPRQVTRSLLRLLFGDSLARNSIYIMGSTALTALIGYLYWVVAAHLYSVNAIGLASALISIITVVSVLAELGIGSTLVQLLPRRKTDAAWSLTLNAGLATGALVGLLAGIIMVLVLPFVSPEFAIINQHIVYTLVCILGVPLYTLSTLLDQTFVAERTSRNMLIRNGTFALFKLALMLLLVSLGALGLVASWVLALALALLGVRTLLMPRMKRAYLMTTRGIVGQVRTMLSGLAWNHFINIGSLLPMYLLSTLVTVRLSVADNAYFYTTSMVGSFFLIISTAVSVSLFAEGSHAEENVLHKARTSAGLIALVLTPAMLISFLGGRSILSLFGPNYAQHAYLLLVIITIGAIPDAVTNIYVSILRVQKRMLRAGFFNLGVALLILVLAWILLPSLGIVAAGWAYLIGQLVGSLVAGIDIAISSRRDPVHRVHDLSAIPHDNP
jgi:O-antigen/teichoic acid export membrane protein